MSFKVIHGNALDLPLEDNSVDAEGRQSLFDENT